MGYGINYCMIKSSCVSCIWCYKNPAIEGRFIVLLILKVSRSRKHPIQSPSYKEKPMEKETQSFLTVGNRWAYNRNDLKLLYSCNLFQNFFFFNNCKSYVAQEMNST